MNDTLRFPEIAFAIVRTPGGPYRSGDVIALAFNEPNVCRLATHVPGRSIDAGAVRTALVPESIDVDVSFGAGPLAVGERLHLSFVDPRFARVHRIGANVHGSEAVPQSPAAVEAPATTDASAPGRPAKLPSAGLLRNGVSHVVAASVNGTARPVSAQSAPSTGVVATIVWRGERAARFVAVVDKLFTVERLGWYRHVLALRLLIPDAIETRDGGATREANAHLQTLRSAAARTFGGPLLAACMPGFSVSREWLGELDDVEVVRSLAGIRGAIASFVEDDDDVPIRACRPDRTVGFVVRNRLMEGSTSSESTLAAFVPCWSTSDTLSAALSGYRTALCDTFVQIADAAEAVRIGAMTQPSHLLDDRLWQLVGAIGEAYDETIDADGDPHV